MSATVHPIAPQSDLDQAWERYKAERLRVLDDASLEDCPAYQAECDRLFNIMMNLCRAECGAPSNVIPFRKAQR